MCGISGFVGNGSTQLLREMNATVAHRGPDGDGFYEDDSKKIYLGHRRLTILDLETGDQPQTNEDDSVYVIFNGEIYNHLDLRAELESCGHIFKTHHSDTEVLVHGYEEWGPKLVSRLNGMFAFAIYDKRNDELFLARDHMGKKPLFYAVTKNAFVFGSEITSVLTHPDVSHESDTRGIAKFFAYGFFPAPFTPYAAVRKLGAGHWLKVDAKTLLIHEECYWQFQIEPDTSWLSRSVDDVADQLRELLRDAVERRLVADVPVGVLISGGLDSTAILALTRELKRDDPIHAFSLGFDDPSFDESSYAKQTAERYNADLVTTKLDIDQMLSNFDDLLTRLDEPLGDSSIMPTYEVCKLASQHIKAGLSGDGGDELFAGYDPMAALTPTHALCRVMPRPLINTMWRMADHLPRSYKNMSLDFKVRRWLRGAQLGAAMSLPNWMGALEPTEISSLVGQHFTAEDLYEEALAMFEQSKSTEKVDRALEYFTNLYMQNGILTKVDRASMLNGLEIRSPFLDRNVVEFARTLPSSLKYRNGERKWILKRAVRGLIDDDIIDRPKKGFGIPLASWLRASMPPKNIQSFNVSNSVVSRWWAEHAKRNGDFQHAMWNMLSLEASNRRYEA